VVLIKAHNRWLITTTFVLALFLTVFPVGAALSWLRPEFITLLVIYWVLVMPLQLSLLRLWLLGCAVDLLVGSMLGQHALALMVVSYVCMLSYQRVRRYALWQQSAFVFLIVGLQQLVSNWVHSLSGSTPPSLVFLMPALASALVWPFLYLYLNRLRLRLRVS